MLVSTWTSGGDTPHSPCSDHRGRRGWWEVVPLRGPGVVMLVSLKKAGGRSYWVGVKVGRVRLLMTARGSFSILISL